MGELAEPTTAEREDRQALARAVLDSVENDERWPDELRGIGDALDFGHATARAESSAVFGLAQELVMLAEAQNRHLLQIRKLQAEVPYEEERGNIATLIAEVGTLKALIAEKERRFAVEHELAMWARQVFAMDAIGFAPSDADLRSLREICRRHQVRHEPPARTGTAP